MSSQLHSQKVFNSLFTNAAHPVGWVAKRIKIGRFVLEDVHVLSREGSHDLNDTLRMANDKSRRVRGAQSRYSDPLPSSAPPRIISIESEDYIKASARKGITPASINAKRHMFRLLRLACGDIPVSDISSRHIMDFWDVHRWWPKDAHLSHKYRGLTDQQILAAGKMANSPPPKGGSVKTAERNLAAFFNHLLRVRVIHHSPIDPFMDVKSDLIGADARRPFSDEELKTLFDPNTYLPWAKKAPHYWWGRILGLYTGGRVNEIAQLKVADIVERHGHWGIDVRKTVDADLSHNTGMRSRQKLKGKSSIRFIPLAQPLIDAGFLDYVADVRATKHPRLFPHLSCGVSQKTGELNGSGYGRGLSERFSKHLHRVLDLPKGFSFHLFRHTLATALDDHGFEKELIASITGHEIKKVVPVLQETYLKGQPMLLIQKQLAALASFKPPVVLPRYERGQFRKQLSMRHKFHP